ncbi:hypothetical protein SAMN05192563_106815, partial [Paraburkholderia aspalathi]
KSDEHLRDVADRYRSDDGRSQVQLGAILSKPFFNHQPAYAQAYEMRPS